MKRFHRRFRWLCILAALLVLLVLFLRQNVLLDTTSKHAILLDAQSGQILAQKRADERAAPASLTKMITILLAIEAEPDLDKQVTLPDGIFPTLQTENASMAGFVPGETVTVQDLLYGAMLPSGAECCENPIQVDHKSFGLKFYNAQGQLIYNSYVDGKIDATCLEGEYPRIARGKESTFQITASGVPADYAKLQFTFWPDLQYNEYTANWVLDPETIKGTGTNG